MEIDFCQLIYFHYGDHYYDNYINHFEFFERVYLLNNEYALIMFDEGRIYLDVLKVINKYNLASYDFQVFKLRSVIYFFGYCNLIIANNIHSDLRDVNGYIEIETRLVNDDYMLSNSEVAISFKLK